MTNQNSKVSPNKAEIKDWLICQLAQALNVDSHKFDITVPFESYGLDSEAAVVLSGELQDFLGCELEPTLLFDYPTIEAVADYLVKIK